MFVNLKRTISLLMLSSAVGQESISSDYVEIEPSVTPIEYTMGPSVIEESFAPIEYIIEESSAPSESLFDNLPIESYSPTIVPVVDEISSGKTVFFDTYSKYTIFAGLFTIMTFLVLI